MHNIVFSEEFGQHEEINHQFLRKMQEFEEAYDLKQEQLELETLGSMKDVQEILGDKEEAMMK